MRSPNDHDRRIGDRVRRARRVRRLSIETLAGLCNRSSGWLSEVERGLRPLDRRSDIAALASALQVDPADLFGESRPPIATEPEGVAQLRTLLHDTALDDPPDVPARPLAVLAELTTASIAGYRRQADYASLTRQAASVLAELHVHANTGTEDDRMTALRLIVELATSAAFCVRHLGAVDLAWIAADRARQAAAALDDPVYIGAAWFGRALARPSAGTARPVRLAGQAADRIQPHLSSGDAFGHQVYGMLHLTAALADQIHGTDPGVRAHLEEAERIAGLVGERVGAWQSFGPANVQVWRAALDIEAGRPGQALALIPQIDTRPLGRNRRAALLMEVARAHAMLGRRHTEQAALHLRDAEKLAPERVRHNPLAIELVADLVDHCQRTAVGEVLRGLAYRMNLST
ncbi:helix-turn-helix domain-containing protein [Planobispora takensis]|uniref:Transcriptional regulator n=1 Tax=Planobispora takensis TaxID=1367882 RepID=A0A8J3WX78_9ACTN|nr:helix-turn-helix transcriptional regulator [Planobispora takensis]GII05754.1 transcriptional regulator [Planobispora takensis]